MSDLSKPARVALWVLAGVAFLGAGAATIALLAPAPPGDGPAELAWDRVICAHCHMHVGEPAFAAQLRDAEGRVLAFDDPGCLWEWLTAHRDEATTGVYYHGADGDGWIAGDAVAFVRHDPTPMGFGWQAVPAGTPGAVTHDTAYAAPHKEHREAGAARGAGEAHP